MQAEMSSSGGTRTTWRRIKRAMPAMLLHLLPRLFQSPATVTRWPEVPHPHSRNHSCEPFVLGAAVRLGEDYFSHETSGHYDMRHDPTPRCGKGCSQVYAAAQGT